MRRFCSISCLVYDNGRPDQTKVSLKEMITDRLLLLSTDAAVTSDYMCMGSKLDYTTGNSRATFVYCVQPCPSAVVPVQSNPSPNFCYHVYKSGFFERVVSYLAFIPNYIQEKVSGFKEYSFCSPDIIGCDVGVPIHLPCSGDRIERLQARWKGCLVFASRRRLLFSFLKGS